MLIESIPVFVPVTDDGEVRLSLTKRSVGEGNDIDANLTACIFARMSSSFLNSSGCMSSGGPVGTCEYKKRHIQSPDRQTSPHAPSSRD